MMKMLKTSVMAAALSLAAGAASAITIPATGQLTIGTAGGFFGPALARSTTTFMFQATEDLKVVGLTFSGLGFNNGNDIGNLKFGYTTGSGTVTREFLDNEISLIPPTEVASTAATSFAPITLAAGETFSFEMNNSGGDFFVLGSGNFTTAPVPIPAAGFMLLTALLGAGAVARRRKTTTA